MLNYKRYKRNPVVNFPERTWPDKEIEKVIKVKMLDVFDYNLKYYYNTSIKFTNSYDIFKKNIDLFLKQDFNLIDIIKEFKLPYPKLDKNSFKRLFFIG